MKVFKFLATTAASIGMLSIVSCSSKTESYIDDIYDELEDATEVLKEDCNEWEDTQDVAEELNEIADNMHEITKDAQNDATKYLKELKSMTPEEVKEMQKDIQERVKEANQQWDSAKEAFQKNDKVRNSEAVEGAINRIDAEVKEAVRFVF